MTVFAFAIQSVILSMEHAAGPKAKQSFLRICDVGAIGAIVALALSFWILWINRTPYPDVGRPGRGGH